MQKKYIILSMLSLVIESVAVQIFSEPALYILAQDIKFDPSSPSDSAILINGSNITLDLGGRSIFQNPNNLIVASALIISTNSKNITIKNGTIRSLPGMAVTINAGSSYINLENLTISDCNQGAINAAGSLAQHLSHITIKDCDIHNCATASGSLTAINAIYADYISLEKNVISGCGTPLTGTLNAINITQSSQINLDANDVLDNQAQTITSINLDTNTNINLKENNIFGNRATAGISIGLNSNNNSAFKCESCIVRDQETTGTVVYGYKIQNSQDGIINNCVSESNKNTSAIGDAYGMWWNNNTSFAIINSIMQNMSAPGQVIGMFVQNCIDSEVYYCQFMNNDGGTLRRGFKLVGGSNYFIAQNIAFRNGTTPAEQFEGMPTNGMTQYATSTNSITSINKPWTNVAAY